MLASTTRHLIHGMGRPDACACQDSLGFLCAQCVATMPGLAPVQKRWLHGAAASVESCHAQHDGGLVRRLRFSAIRCNFSLLNARSPLNSGQGALGRPPCLSSACCPASRRYGTRQPLGGTFSLFGCTASGCGHVHGPVRQNSQVAENLDRRLHRVYGEWQLPFMPSHACGKVVENGKYYCGERGRAPEPLPLL